MSGSPGAMDLAVVIFCGIIMLAVLAGWMYRVNYLRNHPTGPGLSPFIRWAVVVLAFAAGMTGGGIALATNDNSVTVSRILLLVLMSLIAPVYLIWRFGGRRGHQGDEPTAG
jgi:uncharacterized membrane-anchored protein